MIICTSNLIENIFFSMLEFKVSVRSLVFWLGFWWRSDKINRWSDQQKFNLIWHCQLLSNSVKSHFCFSIFASPQHKNIAVSSNFFPHSINSQVLQAKSTSQLQLQLFLSITIIMDILSDIIKKTFFCFFNEDHSVEETHSSTPMEQTYTSGVQTPAASWSQAQAHLNGIRLGVPTLRLSGANNAQRTTLGGDQAWKMTLPRSFPNTLPDGWTVNAPTGRMNIRDVNFGGSQSGSMRSHTSFVSVDRPWCQIA